MNLPPPPDGPGTYRLEPVVLVAEDDASASRMLRMILQRAGYAVRSSADGIETLRILDEGPVPDILLLDWMLPEISGLEVCRRVRERWDELRLPILMVTARADAESISAAFEAGASDYITKPFLGAELRARVAAHLRMKQMADERRQMHEWMLQRETLSTLGLLVSGVAHDLNNPLAGIYGYAQILLEEETDPEKIVALERIFAEVQRCNGIVADLLTFSRSRERERSRVDVGSLLGETLDLRQPHLQASRIAAALSLHSVLPVIRADAGQLQRVFINVMINAEHALREAGGTLRITAEPVPEVSGEGPDWLAIHFYNDGPRIPPDILPRIFDPLFTTKLSDEGTGLGLAICRRILREHGGEITVESGPGGTTFSLLLPPVRRVRGAEQQLEEAPSST